MKACDNVPAFQGDVGFLPLTILGIDKLPDGCTKVTKALNSSDREAYGYHPEKGLVLAQGESRNHYHAFRETDKVELYEMGANDNKRLFLVVNNNAILSHEEHDPILFPKNIYEFGFQYEYTFEDEVRRVAD